MADHRFSIGEQVAASSPQRAARLLITRLLPLADKVPYCRVKSRR